MQIRTIASMILAASGPILSGQTASAPDIERTLYFAHTEGDRNMQEIATAIRTIADIRELSVDPAKKSAWLRAPDKFMAPAEWLFENLDQPPGAPETTPAEYQLPRGGEDSVRVIHIRNAATVQDFQEIATAVRTATLIRRMFTYNAARLIVTRGTASEAAMSAWLFQQLDKPGDQPRQHSSAAEYREPPSGNDVVRVFTVARAGSVRDFQILATLFRAVADLRQIYTYNALRAIVLRGPAEQIVLAERLFDALDSPPASPHESPAGVEYSGPGGVDDNVRVVFLPLSTTPDQLQNAALRVREAAHTQQAYPYDPARAIVLRGGVAQLASAARIAAGLK